jgi:predicted GIY-YIG superfamily endonuclease
MNLNDYGYSRDYAHQCAAWTINNSGPARKQCGLSVVENVGGWIYLCKRHHRLIESEFEREIDTLNSRRVANMQERLDGLEAADRWLKAERREAYAFTEEDYDQRRRAQTVYFLRCEQYIKIGISHDPHARLRQIRKGGGTSFPRRLDIAAAELITTEPGGFEREKELHAKFAHLRHTGEWFTEAPDLTDYINALARSAAA